MLSKLGIIPAAGKAARFGGVLKELLPLPTGHSFLAEAVERVLFCDLVVVVTNPVKIADHARELRGKAIYTIQTEDTDIYGAMKAGMEIEAERYYFTMPDTFMRRNALDVVEVAPFMMGCHLTYVPERFGCLVGKRIVNKEWNIPTPAVAWGALAWTKECRDFWLSQNLTTYTDAINAALDRYGIHRWAIGNYYDNASLEDYQDYLRKVER